MTYQILFLMLSRGSREAGHQGIRASGHQGIDRDPTIQCRWKNCVRSDMADICQKRAKNQSQSCRAGLAGLLLASNRRKCMNAALQPEFHDEGR
jgi:hypothetical protein